MIVCAILLPMKKTLCVLCALVLAASPLALAGEEAEIPFAVAPMFGHNAVLQRDVPLPIWGTAAPGAKVSVCVSRGLPPRARPLRLGRLPRLQSRQRRGPALRPLRTQSGLTARKRFSKPPPRSPLERDSRRLWNHEMPYGRLLQPQVPGGALPAGPRQRR